MLDFHPDSCHVILIHVMSVLCYLYSFGIFLPVCEWIVGVDSECVLCLSPKVISAQIKHSNEPLITTL